MTEMILPGAEAMVESSEVTAEELKKEGLSDEALDLVAGGANGRTTIDKNRRMYCPLCKRDHVISIIKEPAYINGSRYKQYYCHTARVYFIHATNGYFTAAGEQIH
jgi:formate dehydrogenase maturation protein FdhE